MTVLEKRPLKKIEGYVLQLSRIKKAKSGAAKKYFDFSYQTQEAPVRTVCFSSQKWKRLETYKFEGKSCVINNVVRTKQLEFTLTNSSTVKKRLWCLKKLGGKVIVLLK